MVFFILLALFLGPAVGQAQDVDALLERLQAKYDSIQTLRASFTQTITSSYSDEGATSTGTLLLSGDKYRLETETETVVTDGATTWVYLPSDNQVLISDNEEEEGMISPNRFMSDFRDTFDAELVRTTTLEGAPHHELALTPKSKEAAVESATVWMRDQDDLITKMEFTDVNETTVELILTEIELNPDTNEATFTFEAPEGTEVVDLRS